MNRTALSVGALALVATAVPTVPAHAGDPVTKDVSVVTLTEPTPPVVSFGERAMVAGTVAGVADLLSTQEARTVALELRTPNGWLPLRSTDRTDADGQYSVKVPSNWYYRGTVRTTVSESATHLSGLSASTTTVAVKPPYSPPGKASSWSHLFADPEIRWNPCRVITYKVNATGGPDRAVKQVKRALAKVAAATGLRFRHTGSTKAIPWRTDGRKPAYSDAALTISWATPKQVEPLREWTAGLGGGWVSGSVIHRGGITLDRTGTSSLKNGFGTGATWGALLIHEIGHVMGLDHVMEPEQVMYPSILSSTRGRFGAGDLAGLRDQGAMGGCTESSARRRPGLLQPFVRP